ncbi:MAG: S41 family peptidase [Prevotella sp.]|nr:S41 family peptidase [Prevotella sp.]
MRHHLFIIIFLAFAGHAFAQQTDHNFEVSKNLDIFTSLYRDLDQLYVDTIDAAQAIGTGINAMLYSLDPYTVFYPEDDVKSLRQMITGKYAGIGSLIRENLKEGCCIIDQPYRGMPADEAGLRKGDRILAIDDSTMLGKTTDYVSSHLRGDAGSTFKLKIFRPSESREMEMNITRRSIQLPAVPYFGMVSDSIGYINLEQFTEDCAKEVRQAFLELKTRGMRSLIFDLRDNGGGSVAEAVDILNLFIPSGQTILTMKGKTPRANNEYATAAEPVDTIMPVVALVNANTASASEITAGVLQDLDRGVILGEKTFGKGLVQTTIDTPYNGQLKLTTSKYYIPSGRCIQAIDYGKKNSSVAGDTIAKTFFTRCGRIVRERGGITPDILCKSDTLTNLAYYLVSARDSSELVLSFVLDYIQAHPTIAPPATFELSDSDFNVFKKQVCDAGFKYDRQTGKYLDMLKDLAKFEGYFDDAKDEFAALEAKLTHNLDRDLDINRDLLKLLIGRDIIGAYYFDEGAIEFSLRQDSQLQRAVDILNEGEYDKILLPGYDADTTVLTKTISGDAELNSPDSELNSPDGSPALPDPIDDEDEDGDIG